MAKGWTTEAVVEMGDYGAQRLNDLSLALVIPWPSGFPQYWLNADNIEQRVQQLLDATANERLPWQM